MAILVLALPLFDLWPFDTIAAGLAAVRFLAIAGLTLPFGIALSWRHRSYTPSGGRQGEEHS
jgi:hypothetical protein